MGVYIPNMEKPRSCDKCPIRIAELFGVYYDSKDGKSKRIKITGCDSSKYNGKTIAEEEKMMYDHCPLIEIDDELISKFAEAYLEREAEDGNIHP